MYIYKILIRSIRWTIFQKVIIFLVGLLLKITIHFKKGQNKKAHLFLGHPTANATNF